LYRRLDAGVGGEWDGSDSSMDAIISCGESASIHTGVQIDERRLLSRMMRASSLPRLLPHWRERAAADFVSDLWATHFFNMCGGPCVFLCGKKRGSCSLFLSRHLPFLQFDGHAQKAADSTRFPPTISTTHLTKTCREGEGGEMRRNHLKPGVTRVQTGQKKLAFSLKAKIERQNI
jgi:hypothetical protein